MPTLAELRNRLLRSLRAIGIEQHEAQREAELIVEHATGFSTAQQFLRKDEPVAAQAVQLIADIQKQRQQRVPLQYCLGHTWFMGLKFAVRSGVLIPRADTEVLVESSLELLAKGTNQTFLDVGVGSGAIVVSLLKLLPEATAVGIDPSEIAIAVTRENAEQLAVVQRLTLLKTRWQDFECDTKFGAVISNPPYVPLHLKPELEPEVSVFEPNEAVFGLDEDGLGFYRLLSQTASKCLAESGFLAVEVGKDQSDAVARILETDGWRAIQTRNDLNQIPRVVIAQPKA